MYKKICAPCHTIGVGDRVGPDLRGVAERRDRARLASYIRNPAAMRAKNDPVAAALAAKFEGVRMPNLGVSEKDAADLISYLAQEMPAPGADHNRYQHHHKH
jgi:protein SCO1